MDAWVLWIITAVVFAAGETMAAGGFFLAPFALGALVAAGAAAVGLGAAIPIAVFIVVSLLLLTIARPIARSHLRTPIAIRTGTAALVGRDGLVVAAIEGPENVGRVKIEGEVWTARGYDGEAIPEGARVQVVEIRGATALVSS